MQQFPKFTPTRNSTCFSSSAHHQEFIHCTLSNGICHTGTVHTAFEQDQCVPSWSWEKAVYKPLWHIPVPSEQWINSWWWAEELSETCRVSCQKKFAKLVQLHLLLALQPTVGFSLLSDFLPFHPFLTQLSLPSNFHYLYIYFDVLNPSFPWSSSVSPTYLFPL